MVPALAFYAVAERQLIGGLTVGRDEGLTGTPPRASLAAPGRLVAAAGAPLWPGTAAAFPRCLLWQTSP